MANEYGLFWNSENGDRVYDADSLAEWLRHFFTTGVFEGELQVIAKQGMTITVNSGYCNLEGKVKFFETPTDITLDVANASYPRIDTIVIEKNITDRTISLKKVTGQVSSEQPVATEPVRNETQYQIVLAQIYVNTGANKISQANITDTRANKNICGYVTGTVEEIDFSQIALQWTAYLEEFKANNLEEFNTWFETIKGILGTDEGAKLLSMIQELESSKQNKLVSGTNIKTINGESILGEGNLITKALPTVHSNISVSVTPTALSTFSSWDTQQKYGFKASVTVTGLTANSLIQNIVMTDTLLEKVAPVITTKANSLIFYTEDDTALTGTILTLVTSEVENG